MKHPQEKPQKKSSDLVTAEASLSQLESVSASSSYSSSSSSSSSDHVPTQSTTNERNRLKRKRNVTLTEPSVLTQEESFIEFFKQGSSDVLLISEVPELATIVIPGEPAPPKKIKMDKELKYESSSSSYSSVASSSSNFFSSSSSSPSLFPELEKSIAGKYEVVIPQMSTTESASLNDDQAIEAIAVLINKRNKLQSNYESLLTQTSGEPVDQISKEINVIDARLEQFKIDYPRVIDIFPQLQKPQQVSFKG